MTAQRTADMIIQLRRPGVLLSGLAWLYSESVWAVAAFNSSWGLAFSTSPAHRRVYIPHFGAGCHEDIPVTLLHEGSGPFLTYPAAMRL